MKKQWVRFAWLVLCLVPLLGCGAIAETAEGQLVDIQLLATSDLHGMFYPWDYMQDCEHPSGSLAQIATAIEEKYTETTLILDSGDAIQDNLVDTFVEEETNPMVIAMNQIGYDACTTGNHEYNYGMEALGKIGSQVSADVLVGNVWDKEGQLIAKPYAIYEKGGVRIGVIGMVTPNITRWDAKNLMDYTVTDPAEECRSLIQELEGQVDVLVGIMHMGLDNEYGVANSGVTDLANACPEFDVIIASHDHQTIDEVTINGVLVVENLEQAQTLSEIHIYVEKTADGWKIRDKAAKLVYMEDYAPQEEMLELLLPFHQQNLEYAHTVIGRLEGDALAPQNEIQGIPQAQLEDTALIDLVNSAQLYYSGAKVSAACLSTLNAGLEPGNIRLCDASMVYKYGNTLYNISMNGAQLKAFMEWSANYYQQYQPGDLTIAFNPDMRYYLYHMFEGVRYEIDVSKPTGERIQNLTWMDGTPVKEDEEFILCVSNYCACSYLLTPGEIYQEGNLPKLVEIDVHGSDIGSIRDMIVKYIQEAPGGVITPECNHNWKIVGNNWNTELHQKAAEQVKQGLLEVIASEDGRTPNIRPITEKDLK